MPGPPVEPEPAIVRFGEGLGLLPPWHTSRAMRRMSSEERDVYLPQAVGVPRPPPLWNDQPSERRVLHVAKGEICVARHRAGTVASKAPRTPGPVALVQLAMGASPRSSSPNTVGFFSMSSASGRFVGPSLKFGGKRQEAISRRRRQRMPGSAASRRIRRARAARLAASAARARSARCVGVSRSRVAAGSPARACTAFALSQSGSFTRRRDSARAGRSQAVGQCFERDERFLL